MRNMTAGSIPRHLIGYALPMIAGNLCQLTYNVADTVIIGKYLGEDAQAAVSCSNPIMTVMVLGASGLGIGASVLMSRFFGAGKEDRLRREFSTTVIFATLFSLAVFLPGMAFTRLILTWCRVPGASMDMAVSYLRIIFVGFLFSFQYNILSHSMRAVGETRMPMLFLALSCAVNIGLDLLFVALLGMSVNGAAMATTFSQALSAGMCALWIKRKMPMLKPKKGGWVVDRELLKKTASSGLLTALQQAAQPVGKVLIQGVVNGGGPVVIDAFNAVCRVDDFACIPAQNIGSSIMTCSAQNRGAGLKERVKASFSRGLLIALCYFPLICGLTLLFCRPVMRFLAPNGEHAGDIVRMGIEYLRVKAWFFIMPCIVNAIQGYFRGLGRMTVVLASTVLQISVRTLCVFLMVPKIGIVAEAYGCFIGWMCMLLFEGGYLLYLARRGKLIPESRTNA